ncbi:MAG: tetratricopeptide repeat protein [bacterium]
MIIFLIFLQSEIFSSDQVLKFADYLYLQEDYNSAVNEYWRYLFLIDSNRTEIYEKIIDCLVRLKRYDEAIKVADALDDTIATIYAKSKIYLIKGDYPIVRKLLENMIYDTDARRLIGLSYAGEFNFLKAKEFIDLPNPFPRHKNPFLGGLFSLFPGGGHFYCKKIGDGIYSMLVVTTGALVSYYYYHNNEQAKFYTALGFTVLFYAGNIYGGINAVRNYNYYENAKYRGIIFNQD